mgnify:CR=1 FL=1
MGVSGGCGWWWLCRAVEFFDRGRVTGFSWLGEDWAGLSKGRARSRSRNQSKTDKQGPAQR